MKSLNQAVCKEHDAGAVRLLKLGCCFSLTQCEELLNRLDNAGYTASMDHSSSIGRHMRHILERFQSFFQGLPKQHIDYDARKRDSAIELSLESANVALASVLRRLDWLAVSTDQFQTLTVSETVHHQGFAVRVQSTVEREMMSLVTHSVHHLAIIALLAKGIGHNVDQSFGKAPSTVLFERSQAAE